MATSYDLGPTLDPDGTNHGSFSPSWVICVVRFKNRSTFDRGTMASFSTDGSVAASERGDPLVIASDCVNVVTSTNKRSHLSNLVATLKAGEVDYLSEIAPGDWVLCWMTDNEEHAATIADNIRNGKACNEFGDGLKFVGRVFSRFKTLQESGNGDKILGYDLQATGFGEWDASIYYNPYLSITQKFINTWMASLSIAVDKFLSTDGIDINSAMPELIELFFGRGISLKASNPAGEPELLGVAGLTQGEGEAPFSYVVPETVGKLLGKTSRSKSSGVLAYADLLQALIGIQKYGNNTAFGQQADIQAPAPPNANLTPTDFKPMIGKFLPNPPQLSGKSVWSILNEYLNPAVNEMYTCLRADDNGKVLPTFVCRQLPFTSAELAKDSEIDSTTYFELPRWKVPAWMVHSYKIGSSDALRFNFVKMNGDAPSHAQPDIFTFQDVRSGGPVRDDQDIRRSGLRPDINHIACGIQDQQVGPAAWNKIRADFLMGQHLALMGTISMQGIQAPIVEGDNFEFDFVIFHIESVTHTCAITGDGKKRFMTTLQLSYGLRSDDSQAPSAPVQSQSTDEAMYSALSDKDFNTNNPGVGGAAYDAAQEQKGVTQGQQAGDFFSSSGGGLA